MLSVEDYIHHEMKTHKKLDQLIEIKKKKLEHNFNKMLHTNAKDNFNIDQKHEEAHNKRTVLNFSQAEIPIDYSDLLSKGLDYHISKNRLPLLDIISGVEDGTENISATYLKNDFRIECSNILKRGRSKDQINCNEIICRKISTWL